MNCAPIWSATPARTACSGCPVGFSGTFGAACTACPPDGSLCPGLLPLPLLPPAALLARLGAGAQGTCVAAQALGLVRQTSPVGAAATTAQQLVTSLPSMLALGLAGFYVLVLLFYCAAKRAPVGRRVLARLQGSFRACDQLYQVSVVRAGVADVQSRGTALGGFFSLIALATLACLLVWVLVGFAIGNDAVAAAPNMVVGSLATMLNSFPWATPQPEDAAQVRPPLPPGVTVQLRLAGQAKLGCGAPVPARNGALFAAQPLGGGQGQWVLATVPGCDAIAGAPNSLALFTLTCLRCILTPTSMVTFLLNFTCQSFVLEAVVVEATGDLRSLAYPLEASSAVLANATSSTESSSNITLAGSFLAKVDWQLTASLAVVEDESKGGARNAAGYRLSQVSARSDYVDPLTENAGAGVMSLANSIVVSAALRLDTLYYNSIISARLSTSELIASIGGLLGALGVFGVLFRSSKTRRSSPVGRALFGPPSGAATAAAAAAALEAPAAAAYTGTGDVGAPVMHGTGGVGAPVMHGNPLFSSARQSHGGGNGTAAGGRAPLRASGWRFAQLPVPPVARQPPHVLALREAVVAARAEAGAALRAAGAAAAAVEAAAHAAAVEAAARAATAEAALAVAEVAVAGVAAPRHAPEALAYAAAVGAVEGCGGAPSGLPGKTPAAEIDSDGSRAQEAVRSVLEHTFGKDADVWILSASGYYYQPVTRETAWEWPRGGNVIVGTEEDLQQLMSTPAPTNN